MIVNTGHSLLVLQTPVSHPRPNAALVEPSHGMKGLLDDDPAALMQHLGTDVGGDGSEVLLRVRRELVYVPLHDTPVAGGEGRLRVRRT
jgi:hypothetical protein